MQRIADRVVAEGMSVRATEELVRLRLLDEAEAETSRRRPARTRRVTAPGLIELQDDLSDALRARVRISMGARKGKLAIEFASVDDLERIVGVIAGGLDRSELSAPLDPSPSPPAHDDREERATAPVPAPDEAAEAAEGR
jgi:ParB family transcriptional regulator, chromosome partitioning protein